MIGFNSSGRYSIDVGEILTVDWDDNSCSTGRQRAWLLDGRNRCEVLTEIHDASKNVLEIREEA